MNKIVLIVITSIIFCSCRTEAKIEKTSINSADKSDNPEARKNSFSFYLGTYTSDESEGIYKYDLHDNGQIELIGLAARTENPSFLAMSKDKKYLLAVNETRTGAIESYAIKGDTLKLINERDSGGGSPCYISVNEKGYVLAANYNGGNVGLFHLNPDGYLSLPLDVQQHEGQGTTPRQERPHAHFSRFIPNTQTVISVDLGTNELWFAKLDSADQKLKPLIPQTISMAPGAGPRHLVFHPNADWLYVLNELNNTVTVLKRKSDFYEVRNSYSALPNDFCEDCTGADTHISSDGRFLYASIRGHNSIAIFKIEKEGGVLKLIDNINTMGDGPRNFALSPDEKFLIVANRHTNNLVSFRRDEETGQLKFIESVKAPSPVCVLFE